MSAARSTPRLPRRERPPPDPAKAGLRKSQEPARPPVLSVRNRQRTRAVHVALLRRIARDLVERDFGCPHYEVGVHLVAAPEMTRVNEQYLAHAGSTDVITFDHTARPAAGALHGELFICLDDAVAQAREFGTTWPEEVVRYLIHGLLHLRGYDDHTPRTRRVMKREEERLLRAVGRRCALPALARRPRRGPPLPGPKWPRPHG